MCWWTSIYKEMYWTKNTEAWNTVWQKGPLFQSIHIVFVQSSNCYHLRWGYCFAYFWLFERKNRKFTSFFFVLLKTEWSCKYQIGWLSSSHRISFHQNFLQYTSNKKVISKPIESWNASINWESMEVVEKALNCTTRVLIFDVDTKRIFNAFYCSNRFKNRIIHFDCS